jgi:hypothetical protein
MEIINTMSSHLFDAQSMIMPIITALTGIDIMDINIARSGIAGTTMAIMDVTTMIFIEPHHHQSKLLLTERSTALNGKANIKLHCHQLKIQSNPTPNGNWIVNLQLTETSSALKNS